MSRIDITLAIISSAFRSGLEQVRGWTKQFAGDIKDMFAGAFTTGAILAGIQQVMQKAADIKDLSDRFKVGTEEIQRLGIAAQFSATSLETVAKSMNKLRSAQAAAIGGNDDLLGSFAAMGVSAEELASLGTEDLYYKVADAVAGASDETEKLQISSSVFGSRLGGELIPLLEQGGAAIQALGESVPVMSDTTVKSLAKANDEINKLKQTWTVALGTIVGAVLNPFMNTVKSLGAVAGGVFHYLMEVAGEYGGIMAQLFSGDFSGAFDRVKHLGDFMLETMKSAADGVKMEFDDIWAKPPAQPDPAMLHGEKSLEKEQAEEAARLEQQLAEEQEKNDRARMDRQQKINALQEEYNRLLEEAEELSGTEKTAKLIEAEKVKGQLDQEQKSQADEQKREKEKAEAEAKRLKEQQDKEAARKADELARAREQEADADESNKLRGMEPEEEQAYLRDKQKRLLTEAEKSSRSGDELSAVQKRTEAKRLQGRIDSLSETNSEAPRSILTVDSLQRVGGGGNLGNITDPAQRERERQTGLLERIARAVEGQDGGSGGSVATLGP